MYLVKKYKNFVFNAWIQAGNLQNLVMKPD